MGDWIVLFLAIGAPLSFIWLVVACFRLWFEADKAIERRLDASRAPYPGEPVHLVGMKPPPSLDKVTPRAQQVLSLYRLHNSPNAEMERVVFDMSDDDIHSLPRMLVPGILALRGMLRERDPYVWIDPWAR